MQADASEFSSTGQNFQINSQREAYNLTWDVSTGKESLSHATSNNVDVLYSYNENNNRISKTIGDSVITYTYNESKLISELRGNYKISYIYDELESIAGFTLDNSAYYYEKDYDLNIVAIKDSNQSIIAKYEYEIDGKANSI